MNQTTSCNQECYDNWKKELSLLLTAHRMRETLLLKHQKIVFNIWHVLIRESVSNNNIDTEDNACKWSIYILPSVFAIINW